MGRVERSWSGDGLVQGTVVSDSGVPGEPARPEPEQPRGPGAIRLVWRLHGPFIKPFAWIGVLWLYAALAHRTHGLEVRALLTVLPVVACGWRAFRRTRKGTPERLHRGNTMGGWLAVAAGRGDHYRACRVDGGGPRDRWRVPGRDTRS